MVELLQLALNAAVAPARVVGCHPDDELADLLHDAWPADAVRRVGPLGRDQAAVPAHDGVGRDDGRDLGKETAAQNLALRGEAAALVIRESEPPAAELFLQNTILLDEVRDHLGLVPVDPAGERGEEHLQREEVGHRA